MHEQTNSTMPVGILLPHGTAPARIAELSRVVEDYGFGELWVSEDYFFLSGIASAALALQATRGIPVGIGILSAVVRHPALTAMETATLALAFPGRLRLGIGHGVPQWTRQMGLTPRSPLAALREAVTAVRRLLAGETLSEQGEVFRFDAVQLVQPAPGVPILLGVIGPNSLEVAGAIGDGTVISIGAGPRYLEHARQYVARGADRAGRAPPRAMPTYALYAVDRDRDRARAVGREALAQVLAMMGPCPLTAAYGIDDELRGLLERGGLEELRVQMPEQWLDWFLVAGAPEECAERIRALLDAGASSVVLYPLLENEIHGQLELTAVAVLPQVV